MSRTGRDRRAQLALKRSFDIGAAALGLVLAAPLMLLIALAIRASSPGSIVFRQARIGLRGRPFTILKFRTMVEGTDRSPGTTFVAEDDPRITRVGRVLRRTSLDELPQLLNVLRGEMSLVGPRPDLPRHVERYTAGQRERLAMRPGLTGWAQVSGRNDLSWEQRIALDIEYIRDWSLPSDLRVIARTLGVVVSGRGAGARKRGEEVPWGEDAGAR